MKNIYTKGIRIALAAVLFMAVSVLAAYASQGLIYFSDPQTSVGSNVDVNVTIRVEGDAVALGRADVTLKYPENALEFITGENCDGGAGTVRIHGNVAGENVTKLDYTVSFKALKPGQHAVTVDFSEVYDVNENEVQLTHTGSSVITVSGGTDTSSNALLGAFEVSPGVLSPEFSPEVKEYSLNVGLNVEQLTITATGADPAAIVNVSGNEKLSEGENTVVITVTSTDGTAKNEYLLKVSKTSEGEENLLTSVSEVTESQLSDGVQLSSKGKTITVLDLPSDMNIPGSFREGTISIDGNPVQGLVSSSEGSPEYIVIYGMNDLGEMNFYRFDMKEKTIQRYFAEPVSSNTVSVEEFNDVQIRLNEMTKESEMRFILICVLGVLAFALLITVILLSIRVSSLSRENRRSEKYREKSENNILKHGYSGKADETEEDKTIVISQKPVKEESSGITDETVVIKNKETKKEKDDNLDGFEEFKL